MTQVTYAGPLPEILDDRLEHRDRRPLAPGAFLRYQFINRGPNPANNYRWVLRESGDLYLARNTGNLLDAGRPFDADLPEHPTRRMGRREVDDLRRRITEEGFFNQPPYVADDAVEDGSFHVVTARLGGLTHEVIYEGVETSLVAALAAVAAKEEGRGRSLPWRLPGR